MVGVCCGGGDDDDDGDDDQYEEERRECPKALEAAHRLFPGTEDRCSSIGR
jgi:hypothetical protein